jgi:hypothetical protein
MKKSKALGLALVVGGIAVIAITLYGYSTANKAEKESHALLALSLQSQQQNKPKSIIFPSTQCTLREGKDAQRVCVNGFTIDQDAPKDMWGEIMDDSLVMQCLSETLVGMEKEATEAAMIKLACDVSKYNESNPDYKMESLNHHLKEYLNQ